MKSLRVVVSGAGGLIGYSLCGLLGDGTVFGKDYLVTLVLHDIPRGEKKLIALKAELEDCAFEYVSGRCILYSFISRHSFLYHRQGGFHGRRCGFLLGESSAHGRRPQQSSLQEHLHLQRLWKDAQRGCAQELLQHCDCEPREYAHLRTDDFGAVDFPQELFRAEHDGPQPCSLHCSPHLSRAMCPFRRSPHVDDSSLQLSDIEGIIAWGNHGGTMYADTSRATIRGKPLRDLIADNELWEKEFVELVERRGWVLMELRGGVSSALSVARASVVVARWLFQGSQGKTVTLAVCSDGNPYGVSEGLIFGMPVVVENGTWRFVEGLEMNDKLKEHIVKNNEYLKSEIDLANQTMNSL